MGFKTGDIVEWTSSANASWKTKRGKVMAVIPAKRRPLDVMDGLGISHFTHSMAAFDSRTLSRDQESYLVEVNDSKTVKGKPKLYWPRVSALRAVN